MYLCDPTSPAVDFLLRRKLPLVFVDQAPVDGISSVNVADRAGARDAAQHLVDLGHRRVGLLMSGHHPPFGAIPDLSTLVDGYPSAQRTLGWLDALTPAGITPTMVRVPSPGVDEVPAVARLLLDRPDRPTAVLCFSDAIAEALVHTAAELGIAVPGQLSIVGFDDNPLAARIRPALTTVRQDVEAKGRHAAAALTAAIRQEPEIQHLFLPTRLIVRDSTAPPA